MLGRAGLASTLKRCLKRTHMALTACLPVLVFLALDNSSCPSFCSRAQPQCSVGRLPRLTCQEACRLVLFVCPVCNGLSISSAKAPP